MATRGHDDSRAPLLCGGVDEAPEYRAVTDGIPIGPASDSDGEPEVQDGVRRIEAVSRAWSKWSLMIAYMGSVEFENPLSKRKS